MVSSSAFAFSSSEMYETQIRNQDIAFPVAVDSISVAVTNPNSSTSLARTLLSSELTCVKATVMHVFLWTSLAFPLMMQ